MKIFPLIWLVLLFSCGIIKTHNKFISIDTKPRGVKVFYQKEGEGQKAPIGKSPIFQELPKKESGTYTFMYPKNKHDWTFSKISRKEESVCGYIGKESIWAYHEKQKKTGYTKKILKTLNPTEFLIKKSKYECIDVVRAKLPKMKFLGGPECKTYLVIPPKSGYREFSHRLAKEWKKQNFEKNKKKCDKVILPAATEEYMAFLDIDFLDPPDKLSQMDYQMIYKIGKKFKATHIVILNYKSHEGVQTVTPKIYDIHDAVIDPKAPSKTFTVKLKKKGFKNFLWSTFRFIPNGGAIMITTLNKIRGDNSENTDIRHLYDNFKFGVTLDNIQYPQRKWMFNTKIMPVLVFNKWGRDVEMNVWGLTLDLKMFLHLPPGGVLVYRIGGGGAYINAKGVNVDYGNKAWTYMADMGLEFYFFPWKRIYMNVGYKIYAIDPAKFQYDNTRITGESHLFFEVGYFFPELRMKARNWL